MISLFVPCPETNGFVPVKYRISFSGVVQARFRPYCDPDCLTQVDYFGMAVTSPYSFESYPFSLVSCCGATIQSHSFVTDDLGCLGFSGSYLTEIFSRSYIGVTEFINELKSTHGELDSYGKFVWRESFDITESFSVVGEMRSQTKNFFDIPSSLFV